MEARQFRHYQMLVPHERRQVTRHVPQWGEATLESDIFSETVQLIDVGRLGFSVRTIVAYPQGSRLVLRIKGHQSMDARAVWHADNRLGAWFDNPLDDGVLASLIGEG